MRRERTIIGGLLLLQLILWLGFLVHRSPRFAGSLAGGILAVSGALLMIAPPVLYSAAKRVEFFKRLITRRVSLGRLLSWHVYTSVVGAILAILHTGHRFESNLGITLTASMLLAVLSGFVGRYYFGFASLEIKEKRDLLNELSSRYNRVVAETSLESSRAEIALAASQNFTRRALNSFFGTLNFSGEDKSAAARLARLAESIADVEYAIKTHELLKRRAARWLKFHVAASAAFYVLLALHIWAAIYFGLRWFN